MRKLFCRLLYFTIEQEIADETPLGNYGIRLEESRRKKEAEDELIYAPKAKVLVVDDNIMNLNVLEKLLGLCGITPDLVSSGEESLEYMRKKTYDIVFMDHMMPQMDGIETFHKLKDEGLIPEKTVMIMLSANAIAGSREKYMKEGFDDYLSKPIPLPKLVEMLKNYLDKSLIVERPASGEKISDTEPEKKDILPAIEGINREKAFSNMPDGDFLISLFKTFCDMSSSDIKELDDAFERGVVGHDREALSLYRVKVHGMKNSAAQIGAGELSEEAKELETAARELNIVYINEHHAVFTGHYLEMAYRIRKIMFKDEDSQSRPMDDESLLNDLKLMETALNDFDTTALNELSFKLGQYSYPSKEIEKRIAGLQDAVRDFDVAKAGDLIGEIRDLYGTKE